MDFPDQIRIRHVREALWRRSAGGASVMVGSGFSRNAEMKAPGAGTPPDWAEVASAMRAKLKRAAVDTGGNGVEDTALDALGTAQRYSDEFGRAELHRFLRDQIRDEDMEPGDLHRRLLALPWVDVFTTNWDTLLERTRELTVSPTYEVVRAIDELPLASRPRIVKLHGSLPAHFPLIATEQDYSEYPKRFAPFVNTARQALMETLFLLLGFSGDDPNFLRWSEWVRKELGTSAPKIYLAGWLDLRRDVRHELEERGVVPIDLANHPEHEEWRRQRMEHRFAMEWLLTTLESGEPYPLEEWPKALAQPGSSVPTHLEPVDRTIWRAPRVPAGLPDDEDGELADDKVDDIVATWAHNRELYPGWLVLPEQLRRDLLDPWLHNITGDLLDASKEERIVKGLASRALAERLRIVHEIVWRREIRLEPLGAELALVAKTAVEEVANSREDSKGPVLDRRAARGVAMALVTHARFGFNRNEFDEAVRIATGFAQHDRNALHHLEYEKCLWALYETDTGSLVEALDAWRVEDGDPYWAVRKASLMFEVGHGSEQVLPMLRSAIAALRRSRGYSLDISLLSRESWAAYLARRLEKQSWSGADGSDPHRRRVRDLARFNCDPPNEIRALINAVEWREETEKGPGFELGEGPRPRGLVEFRQEGPSPDWYRARVAHRIVRLAEVTGLPTLSDRWPPTKTMLGQASEALHRQGHYELALRLMLRVTSYDGDELIRKLLSRTNVATLPETVVESIAGRCEQTIDYYTRRGLHHDGARGTIPPRDRVRVAMETLARLSLRFKANRAAELLQKGLAIYGNPLFYTDILFRDVICHLLSWSWEAVPRQDRADLALELLSAPIAGVDGYTPNVYLFLDPGELIDRSAEAVPSRDERNSDKWNATVKFLVRALAFGEEARSRAMLRLVQIALAGRLTADEERTVGTAIWATDDSDGGGLPGENRLRHWVYLCLPEPEPGLAQAWFREKWMSAVELSNVNDELLDNMLFHVADALERSRQYGFSFELGRRDGEYLTSVLRRWAVAPMPLPWILFDPFGQERRDLLRNGIRGATTLLMHLKVPEDVAEALYEKYQQLGELDVPAMPLLVGLVRSLKGREAEIHTALRKGLASDDPQFVSNTAIAMQFWLDFARRSMAPRPPSDLIREIGVIIATRRIEALGDALWVAEWVFANGEDGDRQELRQLVVEGLRYLIDELDYAREFPKEADVPLLRWRCVGLARAMQKGGCDETAVMDWLAVAQEDPLPEIRHKVSDIVLNPVADVAGP